MSLPQPVATVSARRMMQVLEVLRALRRRTAFAISGVALAAVLAVDYATGLAVNVGFAYTLLICFTAWTLGHRHGLLMTVAIAVAINAFPYLLAIGDPTHVIPPAATQLWNIGSRTLTGALLVLLVGGLRASLDMERWRAETDGLTGALNKAAFRRRMAATVEHAGRTNRALMLAYIDLDGFKAVNDRFGHSAGDTVLTVFARAAGAAIRQRDLFARIGGDEFVVLMTTPDCDSGDMMAETLHHRLSTILRDTGHAVTCSMGALVIDGADAGGEDDFIAMADALMYEVKRSGKNALRIARHAPLGGRLRQAFPPETASPFSALLARIDRADAAMVSRRAA